jgi:hypothetical protein
VRAQRSMTAVNVSGCLNQDALPRAGARLPVGGIRCGRALGRVVAGAVILTSTVCSAAASADSPWRFSVHAGQWAHENLSSLPVKSISRRIDWRDQFIVGAGVSRVLLTGLPVPVSVLRSARLEFETRLVGHLGIMAHPELTAAFVLRSPDIELWGGLRVNAAVGQGLSFAFRTPQLEGVRKERRPQQLLNYLLFEAEIAHSAHPGVYLVPQLHHRSGVFGLVGPRGDGSNYVGLGVRFDLR